MNEEIQQRQHGRRSGSGYRGGNSIRKVTSEEVRKRGDEDPRRSEQGSRQGSEGPGQAEIVVHDPSNGRTEVSPHLKPGRIARVNDLPFRKLQLPRQVPTEYFGFSLFENEKGPVISTLVTVADKEGFTGPRWREEAFLHLCELYAEEYGDD